MAFIKSIVSFLLEQRETIVGGVYWLAELEPFYFSLFCYLYAAGIVGFLGICMLVK